MKIKGDIVIIEKNPDHLETLISVFDQAIYSQDYANRVVFIEDFTVALDYLKKEGSSIFMLILCQDDLTKINGIAFEDSGLLNDYFIPYLLLTAEYEYGLLSHMLPLSFQGIFKRPESHADYVTLIEKVLGYWKQAVI